MRTQFLNGAEDIQWVKDTALKLHLKNPAVIAMKAFVLHGNDDCPAKIEVYPDADPKISDTPWTWLPYGNYE